MGAGAWHDSKVALLSATVFAPAAIAMMINAHLSKRAQERHWHGCLPVFAAGICFEYVSSCYAICLLTAVVTCFAAVVVHSCCEFAGSQHL